MLRKQCSCKDCKKMAKKGFILGSRKMGFFMENPDKSHSYYYGSVSCYVPHHRLVKGRKALNRRTVKVREI